MKLLLDSSYICFDYRLDKNYSKYDNPHFIGHRFIYNYKAMFSLHNISAVESIQDYLRSK